ncbi:alpha/beta hydrolase [Saccharothrix coeruleofusca]|uniref:Alpha/beta hydrolase n=1 Tax=Saccharothrix coeruleofusca TaxID=33919 RepID=A0A918AXC8_9PSEU|nr:alpha/beta hydrolase [Saccharothrix coeruleofusca]
MPGAGGTVRANFGSTVPALSRGRQVIGVDHPGPEVAGRLELDDLADRLVAAAGPAEEFAVLGFSLGCAVAVRAAVRHPDRVRALVLTAGLDKVDAETDARLARWQRLLRGDRAELARFLVSTALGEPFQRGMDPVQLAGLEELIAATVPEGSEPQVDLVRRVDLTDDAPRVAVPTLVIGTKHDRLITPARTRALADAIPGARWAELATGHAPALEAPREWVALVEGFLAEI